MNYNVLVAFSAAASVLAGCNANRLVSANYDYSYISATETYASSRRTLGELYIFDPSDPDAGLEILDVQVPIANSDLRSGPAVNVSSTRVSGATVTLALDANNKVTGSAEFAAMLDADGFEVRSVPRSKMTNLVESLYTDLKTSGADAPNLPLDAKRVIDEGLYYAVISGAGSVDKLELSHGTPEGKPAGVNLKVGGQEYVDISVSDRTVFTCEKSDASRPQCTVEITVYSAQFTDNGEGGLNFDVKPRTVSKSMLSTLFQDAFSR